MIEIPYMYIVFFPKSFVVDSLHKLKFFYKKSFESHFYFWLNANSLKDKGQISRFYYR